jgi:hypothetical protein
MPNYTYRCREGHETDRIRQVDTNVIKCSCGKQAARVSVYRQAQVEFERKVNARDFLEASEMLASRHEEFEQREGVAASPPPLWRMAKQKASRLIAQGAPDSRSVW